MKKMLGFVVLAMAVLAIGFVVGCATTDGTPKPKIETVSFQPTDDGWVRFFTNDRSMYEKNMHNAFANPNADPNVYEMDVQRISGFLNMGYGMVFGAKDDRNLYAILVRANGSYSVEKLVNGTRERLQSENSDQVNQGYNTVNTIKVVKSGNAYAIYLNGNAVPVYTLNDTAVVGNQIGYWAFIGGSGYEKFPDIPVEVLFKVK